MSPECCVRPARAAVCPMTATSWRCLGLCFICGVGSGVPRVLSSGSTWQEGTGQPQDTVGGGEGSIPMGFTSSLVDVCAASWVSGPCGSGRPHLRNHSLGRLLSNLSLCWPHLGASNVPPGWPCPLLVWAVPETPSFSGTPPGKPLTCTESRALGCTPRLPGAPPTPGLCVAVS